MLAFMRNPSFSRALVALAILGLAAPAAAQGGVSNSGMGQGEARITSRSDVRLAMESMPGTPGAAVSALGQNVGAKMPDLRRCYSERVEENPTVTGTLRLRYLLANRGAARIEVDRDDVHDREVVQCITRVLGRVETRGLTRPTRAIVQLQLANTAAEGVRNAAERATQAQQVTLTNDDQGNPSSSAGTPDRGVRFTVAGRGARSGPAVVAAHRALLTALPGLMDCRRRSARQGRAPGGDLTATMQVRAGAAPVSRVTASTVPNERTRGCVQRVLGAIEQRPTEGRGNVRVQIHFEPADQVAEATD